MKQIKFTCNNCGSSLGARDLNMETAIARCTECDSVFSFASALPKTAQQNVIRRRPQVDKPARIDVQEWGSELTITWRWFTAAIWFLVLFGAFWNGFLVVWYTIAFTAGAPWIMFVFPLLHVAVGVGIAYAVFAAFLNRTTIRVDPVQISIRHHPLPSPGNRDIFAADVDQLYCAKKRRKNSCTYELRFVDRNGKKTTLVGGLRSAEEAMFLEQKIEQHLNVADRRIRGEIDVNDDDYYDDDDD